MCVCLFNSNLCGLYSVIRFLFTSAFQKWIFLCLWRENVSWCRRAFQAPYPVFRLLWIPAVVLLIAGTTSYIFHWVFSANFLASPSKDGRKFKILQSGTRFFLWVLFCLNFPIWFAVLIGACGMSTVELCFLVLVTCTRDVVGLRFATMFRGTLVFREMWIGVPEKLRNQKSPLFN
jgi:hypothetical protein